MCLAVTSKLVRFLLLFHAPYYMQFLHLLVIKLGHGKGLVSAGRHYFCFQKCFALNVYVCLVVLDTVYMHPSSCIQEDWSTEPCVV